MRIVLNCVFLFAFAGPCAAVWAQDDGSDEDVAILEEAGTEVDDGQPPEETDGVYSSFGLTQVTTDFDNLEDAVNLDAVIGFPIPGVSWLAAELNLSQTVIPGENTGPGQGGGGGVIQGDCITETPVPLPPGCTPDMEQPGGGPQGNFTRSSNDLQLFTAGLFAVVRTPGTFYGLGRIGYRYINASIEEINEADTSGTAYGIGAGYRIGSGRSGVELIYTRYSDQLDYLTLNISYGISR